MKYGLSDAAIRRLAQASWGDLAQYGYDPKEMDTTLSQAVQLLTQARELLTPYVSQGAGGGALDSIVNQLDSATLGLTNLGSEDSPMTWAGESSGLVAKKRVRAQISKSYSISDGNAQESADDWDAVLGIVADWYDFIAEQREDLPEDWSLPFPDFSNVGEGDVEGLNDAVSAWENEIAESLGYAAFQGHGNYGVNPASEMGLNLAVREEGAQ